MQTRSVEGSEATKGLASRLRRWLRRPAHLEPVDRESWYVVLDGEFHGPISRHTLAEVLAEHRHDEDAPIWSASHAEEWTTMRAVPGLAEEVAVCRAAQVGHEPSHHPSELAPFVASRSEPPPPMRPSNSGELDIGAALRSMTAKNAPISPELLASVSITGAAADTWPQRDRRVARKPERRTWLGTGVLLGGLACAAFIAPFIGPATCPLPPPPEDLAPHAITARPPSIVAATLPPAARVSPDPVTVVAAPTEAEPAPPPSVAPDSTMRRRAAAPAATTVAAAAPPATAADAPPANPFQGDEAPPAARSLEQLLVAAAPIAPAPPPPREVAVAHASPTDAEVVRALDAVRDAVVACTPVHAVAALRITFHGDTGRVNGLYVDGVFAGTPAGSCIARAVRGARVAPFTDTSFTFSYPYRL